VAAFVGVTISGAYLVGHFAATSPDTFAWDAAVGAGTAIGTVLLALVTTGLALLTRLDVSQTAQIAAARNRPVLVEGEGRARSFNGETGRGRSGVTVTNVGVGPTLRVNVSAT
jgi:hypothetical protein